MTQRSREIGLRMALGATARRVVTMVVLRVAATDPGTYGAVALLLCALREA